MSIALHALVHLHLQGERELSSEALATCLMTNAVVVRRILGELRDAGLVRARKGPNGGWSLAKPPEAMTLLDIYSAMGERLLIRTESDPGDVSCGIVRSVDRVMHEFLADAEALLAARLGRMRLSDLAREAASAGFPHLG